MALTASLKTQVQDVSTLTGMRLTMCVNGVLMVLETSSELSVQSKSPSHRKREEMHSPLAQMKFFELHVTGSKKRKRERHKWI